MKRRISAKAVVSDIRSGMDDCALMAKYQLTAEGLRSLFDKLVMAGYIDVGEIQDRVPGFLGTVTIEDPLSPGVQAHDHDASASSLRPISVRINAQEAARDIRLGATDCALMEKYGLSHMGIQSLLTKLLANGFITQEDIERRNVGIDTTVDLQEETLSLSEVTRRFAEKPSFLAVSPTAEKPENPLPSPVKPSSRTPSPTRREQIMPPQRTQNTPTVTTSNSSTAASSQLLSIGILVGIIAALCWLLFVIKEYSF